MRESDTMACLAGHNATKWPANKLPIVDQDVIISQYSSREKKHLLSAKSKARGEIGTSSINVSVGDLVFLKGYKSKLLAREKYLVVDVGPSMCQLYQVTVPLQRVRCALRWMLSCISLPHKFRSDPQRSWHWPASRDRLWFRLWWIHQSREYGYPCQPTNRQSCSRYSCSYHWHHWHLIGQSTTAA